MTNKKKRLMEKEKKKKLSNWLAFNGYCKVVWLLLKAINNTRKKKLEIEIKWDNLKRKRKTFLKTKRNIVS